MKDWKSCGSKIGDGLGDGLGGMPGGASDMKTGSGADRMGAPDASSSGSARVNSTCCSSAPVRAGEGARFAESSAGPIPGLGDSSSGRIVMDAPASSRGAWLLPLNSSAAFVSQRPADRVVHQCWPILKQKR